MRKDAKALSDRLPFKEKWHFSIRYLRVKKISIPPHGGDCVS